MKTTTHLESPSCGISVARASAGDDYSAGPRPSVSACREMPIPRETSSPTSRACWSFRFSTVTVNSAGQATYMGRTSALQSINAST
jgi:hypothetical protein